MAEMPKMEDVNFSTQQHRLLPFVLLVYRWVSLVPAVWLFVSTEGPVTLERDSIFLLAVAAGVTLLVTVIERFSSRYSVFRTPLLLSVDLVFMSVLLAFSGASSSLYTFHALSPLLAGAFFFQMRGTVLVTGGFTLFYLLTLLVFNQLYPITLEPGQLFTQLAGAWLVTLMFGSLSLLLKQLPQVQEALVNTYNDLTRRNAELAETHRHLGAIHDLTLALQSSDSQSVQHRLLKTVTTELGFSKAVIGLVNSSTQRLEEWQAIPALNEQEARVLLPITATSGLIAQSVLEKQVRWSPSGQTLVMDDILNRWFIRDNWLILPLIWQERTVGVLLVSVKEVGHVDVSDDRWAVLTSLVSQAAVALGTIDKTRHLAIEKERNRIAREIHDTVAQSLFGIAFTLDACVKLLPEQADTVQQELIELRHMAHQVRQDVRQSILDIWPSELTQERFITDLEKYVTHCSPFYVFNVDFSIDGDFDRLSPTIRRGLYRVCQEALANAARHSGVDAARVMLFVESNEVHMSVRDNGKGFDSRQALAREHNRERFGLKGMCERVQSLGGTCDIQSREGHGTQVMVTVPANARNGYEW